MSLGVLSTEMKIEIKTRRVKKELGWGLFENRVTRWFW